MGRLPIKTSAVSAAATKNCLFNRPYSLPRTFSTVPSSSCTTPYPAPSTARTKSRTSAVPARYSTVALSTARLTFTSSTPGTPRSALSTLPTQLAHDIPVTPKPLLRLSTPYPASSTARIKASGPELAGSYSTVAFSTAKFTFATETPRVPASASSTRRPHAAQLIPTTGSETFRSPSPKELPFLHYLQEQYTIPPYRIARCLRQLGSLSARRLQRLVST